jgi:hypothetical protein
MPQVFHPSMNTVSRLTIFGAVLIAVGLLTIIFTIVRSPYVTEVGVVREQPVPFSHEHHVGDVGLDCRYCHTSVEDSSFAGIPPTATCMNCHSQLFAASAMLAPVRVSYSTGKPLEWTRVNDLPDFVYFNHSIHVKKGMGCETCHGRIDEMPLTLQENTLQMEWCINCHRTPENYIRPRSEIYTMGYKPPVPQSVIGPQLAKEYGIPAGGANTSCSTCHR